MLNSVMLIPNMCCNTLHHPHQNQICYCTPTWTVCASESDSIEQTFHSWFLLRFAISGPDLASLGLWSEKTQDISRFYPI